MLCALASRAACAFLLSNSIPLGIAVSASAYFTLFNKLEARFAPSSRSVTACRDAQLGEAVLLKSPVSPLKFQHKMAEPAGGRSVTVKITFVNLPALSLQLSRLYIPSIRDSRMALCLGSLVTESSAAIRLPSSRILM